jgi:hypothetical protein
MATVDLRDVWGCDVSAFVVCRTCGQLRGPLVARDGERREQRCTCTRGEREETWPRFDFNTAAELCQCCVREVIPSGSKFSSYFCNTCRKRVLALDQSVALALIPLGRHSVMNSIALPGAQATDRAAVERFTSRLLDFFARDERLSEWRTERARDVLAHIPGGDPVPVEDYLRVARRRIKTKQAAFDGLVDWFA